MSNNRLQVFNFMDGAAEQQQELTEQLQLAVKFEEYDQAASLKKQLEELQVCVCSFARMCDCLCVCVCLIVHMCVFDRECVCVCVCLITGMCVFDHAYVCMADRR
jgi:hypothetical protein